MFKNITNPQNILVVGGTGGIGRAIAEKLAINAPQNSNLTIVGRNKDANDEIKAAVGESTSNINFIQADVSLMSEVKKVVEQYSTEHDRLDILVLTQGVLTFDHILTKENIDYKLALHYYSKALFIKSLVPLLEKSKNAKVLSVLDGSRADVKRVDWDDMALEKDYSLSKAASHAITFNDIMVQKLAKDHPNMSFSHAYPGVVSTGIGSSLPWYARYAFKAIASVPGLTRTPAQCADNMIKGMFTKESGWACIDSDGSIINKQEVTKDIMDKLELHNNEIFAKSQ
ncbi:dehydrogenase/reductase SDR family member [Acrasis kona]|uniref:Dehydrogenase/reductase SDR family member n=1 Tax=Acrasis kona TaxID=1008807 RepID=A0AAW2YWI2_9EUKA